MQNHRQINRLKNTVQGILDEAAKQGASAAEAGLSQENGLSVSVRLGDVETIEHHCDQGLGVTVYFGKRKGSASTTDLSQASIKETVSAACSIARYTSEDEFSGLPEQELLATEFPDLELNHPWDAGVDGSIALAIECEDAARSYHAEISNSEGASVDTHQGIRVMGNSLGFLQGYASTRHSLSCSVLAQRGDSMQRDYWYTVARNALNLESAVDVGNKAAERTLRRLQARSLSTRQCPVLYCAETASGLLSSFIGAISGGNLYRKSSFLLDALDTQVFPEFVRIHEEPFLKGALGSGAYDGEGVDHVEVARGQVRKHLCAQPVVAVLLEHLVDLAPPDPLLGAALAGDELVAGRAARVPAGVDDERAAVGQDSLVTPQRVRVEDRRRGVPPDRALRLEPVRDG